MKTILTVLILSLNLFTQTTLNAGDIAIIGFNTNPDGFMFVPLLDIQSGTVIYFSDNAVSTDSGFVLNSTEGVISYTFSSDVIKGTVIEFSSITGDYLTIEGSFAIANSGDNLIAFQGYDSGSNTVSRFLYAVASSSVGITNNPGDLSSADQFISTSQSLEFNGLRSGKKTELYSSFNNSGNYTMATTVNPFDLTAFSVGPADPQFLSATANGQSQIDLSFTKNSSNDSVMIAMNTSNSFGTPVGAYTIGSSLSGGASIIYVGIGSAFSHIGLNPNSTYYYRIWSKDKIEYSNNYLAANATTDPSPNSSESDILSANNEVGNISYQNYTVGGALTSSNSIRIWSLTIRDGGADNTDGDILPTTLNSISMTLSHHEALSQMALFDGTTNLSQQTIIGSSVSFNSLSITAGDESTKTIDIYVSFKSTVTDNQQIQLTINAVSSDLSSSVFQSASAGGATSSIIGDANRLEVSATKLQLSSISDPITKNIPFSATVIAIDANNNLDLDASTAVTISKISGLGEFSSTMGLSQNLISGTITWTDLIIDQSGSMNQLQVIDDAAFLNSGESNYFLVQGGVDFVFNALNDTITENFNGYNGSGYTGTPTLNQLNSNFWIVTGMLAGDMTYGGTYTGGAYANGRSVGSVSTGGLYAFTLGASDYGQGFQPTANDLTPGSIVLRAQNNTGSVIQVIRIQFELWINNNEGRSSFINFEYSNDGSNWTTYQNYTTPTTADANGFQMQEFVLFISNLSIANGSNFYVRWSSNDVAGSGSRDEIAIDDFQLSVYENIQYSINGTIGSNINRSAGSLAWIGYLSVDEHSYSLDSLIIANRSISNTTSHLDIDSVYIYIRSNINDPISGAPDYQLDWLSSAEYTGGIARIGFSPAFNTSGNYIHVAYRMSGSVTLTNYIGLAVDSMIFSFPKVYNFTFPYQVAGDISLPVRIKSFSAIQKTNQEVQILLETASESEETLFRIVRIQEGIETRISEFKNQGSVSFGGRYEISDYLQDVKKSVRYRLYENNQFFGTEFELIMTVQDYQIGKFYPNPFNPVSQINLIIPELTRLQIQIYNSLGQRIYAENYPEISGSMQFYWNGVNHLNQEVAGGVYFVQIRMTRISDQREFFHQQKIILLK